MPFDEEPDELLPAKNTGLKKVSSQKSIFDSLPKKPSPEEFQKRVAESQEIAGGYKREAAELTKKFFSLINDKTLKENKSVFDLDFEKEVLAQIVKLATTIDNDPNEPEGIGSLSWITILLKVVLSQRNRLNQLEYQVSDLNAKLAKMPK